MPKIAATASV